MTIQHNSRYTDERRSGPVAGFIFGCLCTLLLLVAGAWLYLRYGHPPVAAADPAFPMEAQIVHVPLNHRISRELTQPPFGTSEEGYETGAKIYVESCAACHGTPNHPSAYGKYMYPAAPQLWKKHGNSAVVGVSDDEAGETFWKIKNGIRLTGMPAYNHLYSEAEMWQVALLLKNADQTLPDPVQKTLSASSAPASVAPTP